MEAEASMRFKSMTEDKEQIARRVARAAMEKTSEEPIPLAVSADAWQQPQLWTDVSVDTRTVSESQVRRQGGWRSRDHGTFSNSPTDVEESRCA